MQEGKKIGRMIYTGLIVLSVMVLGLTLWAKIQRQRSGGRATVFGYTPTVVISGSMIPALQINSINIVKNCAPWEVTVGDIIVFWSDLVQGNVIHRVVEVKTENGQRKFKTKGDSNLDADPGYVTEDNLIGKVVYIANWMVPVMERVMKDDGSGVDYGRVLMVVFPVMIAVWSVLCVICWVLHKFFLALGTFLLERLA